MTHRWLRIHWCKPAEGVELSARCARSCSPLFPQVVMKALGMDAKFEEIRKLVNDIDTHGDGTIDFDMFWAMMTARKQVPSGHTHIRHFLQR